MKRMRMAPWAIFLQLQALRIVTAILTGSVIALLAFGAGESYNDADVFFSHTLILTAR
jgi:hypothetical protein